ncbi:MAG: thioredoxin [Micrococcales bacterium]|nr:thioredoxin [Micrococcales bacterium]
MSALADVNDQTFEAEVIQASLPVLVDFWAPWCGPCRQLMPIVEQLATEHGDKIKFVKINIDENPQTARQQNVVSVPTLNVFKDGQLVKAIVGARPKPMLVAELSEYLT